MPRRLPAIALVTAALLAAFATLAVAEPAVSPILHHLGAATPAGRLARAGLAVHEGPGGVATMDLIVNGSMTDSDLEAQGATIGARLLDGTRTIRIPVDRFAGLKGVPGLARITASYQCRPLNNTSVPATNVTPSFWTRTSGGVFAGNAGANVIVGEVDTGIDWTSSDFKNPDGSTRILSIWDQTVPGAPPASFSYGTEWTAAQINAGTCTHHDIYGHGTHVMGTAAGNGSATGNGQPAFQFTGMAPRADIIVVATDFSTASIIDGVNYIFQMAAVAGKNAVVNLSLGTSYGAHDGSDAFDTAIDAMTGPGQIVVVAAGNDGNAGFHARKIVPPGAAQTVTFNIPPYTPNAGTLNDYFVIDAYYPAAANMSVTLTSPGPTPVVVGPVALGGSIEIGSSAAGDTYIQNGLVPSAGGDRNVFIEVFDSNSGRPPRVGTWTITLTPISVTPTTRFDAWQAQSVLGTAGPDPSFTSDVDESALITSPGSSAQAITVGAYISKVTWPSIDGTSHSFPGLASLGTMAYFSSPGPLRNGAAKPDIAAPGTAIVSTKSSFMLTPPAASAINLDGQHYSESGTSMASPHVAGACAVLLAETPNMTPAQLKARLTSTATVDANTGAVPNALWGSGKLRIRPLADTQAPSVSVTAPNGGETWVTGSSHNITWNAIDNVGVNSVTIEYSLNNGAAWLPIASGQPNSGSYAWTVPQAVSTQALVRVTALDAASNAGADASNTAFSLADQTPPVVALAAPNGGELLQIGSTRAITWAASDNVAVASVSLAYSINGGGNWTTIATGEPNDGTYAWLVPPVLTSQGLVRVTASDGANAAFDVSDSTFSIFAPAAAPQIPMSFSRPTLLQNRPNPFSGSTRLGFGLPRAGHVRVAVYSIDGRCVRTLADREFAAGYTELAWNGHSAGGAALANGIYFVRLEADGVRESRRLVLLQ